MFEEIAATVEAYDSLLSGGVDYAREVLERALGPERALEIIGRLSSVIEMRPFEFLRRTPAEQLVTFLRNESPQTVALVIANLHTTLASQVLANLPGVEQAEIAVRIARMGETSPDIVKQVESVMKKKLDSVVQQEYSVPPAGSSRSPRCSTTPTAGPSATSTRSPRPTGARDRGPACCSCSRTSSARRPLDPARAPQADQKDLALALRGVNDDVKERILSNMSERGATMLVEEMAYQRRSASASSKRPRGGSWRSCASSRRPGARALARRGAIRAPTR